METTEEYGPTLRYINTVLTALDQSQQQVKQLQQQLQQLQQLQQQYLNNLRAGATSFAEHVLKMYRRGVYSGYDDALSDYLSDLEPSEDFRDEAIQIFNDIWKN